MTQNKLTTNAQMALKLASETAIRKSTALPAESLGLKGRGRIAAGAFADLVVFDPCAIGTDVDFAHPDRRPRGIEHVLINGVHVLDQGRYDDRAYAGHVLRRG